MSQDKKKTYLVIGLGASGRSACAFLARRGYAVIGVDRSESESLRASTAALVEAGVDVRLGERPFPTDVDRVVVSPGVPPERYADFREKKIPVMSELELGAREISVPIVAVTGTNGKSTVVTNIEKGLGLAGKKARAVGNLGIPVTEWVDTDEALDAAVIEVSSFQLETVRDFHPRVAVVLNIAPDHLVWHGSLENYIAAKARITEKQTIDDALLLHKDLTDLSVLQRTRARLYWYGRNLDPSLDGLSFDGKNLRWRGDGRDWSLVAPVEKAYPHEIENLLAVVASMLLLGVDPEKAIGIFSAPARLPHRLEPVATVGGVLFLNDSKATNAHAAAAALGSVTGDIHWLVGGEGKGEDLTDLVSRANEAGLVGILCFGRDRAVFEKALRGVCPVTSLPTLREAFEQAARQAGPGDTVLLSPAAASFDEYTSFENRGDDFKRRVAEWKERAA